MTAEQENKIRLALDNGGPDPLDSKYVDPIQYWKDWEAWHKQFSKSVSKPGEMGLRMWKRGSIL